jgi:flagellar hook-basal body complex protein FliE
METLGKKYETRDASISNRIQDMEERISGAEDSREHLYNNQRKFKKILTQNIQEIQDKNEKAKPTDNRSR